MMGEDVLFSHPEIDAPVSLYPTHRERHPNERAFDWIWLVNSPSTGNYFIKYVK